MLDAADGSEVFRFNTGTPNNGGVATYAIGGQQYVSVMAAAIVAGASQRHCFWSTLRFIGFLK